MLEKLGVAPGPGFGYPDRRVTPTYHCFQGPRSMGGMVAMGHGLWFCGRGRAMSDDVRGATPMIALSSDI